MRRRTLLSALALCVLALVLVLGMRADTQANPPVHVSVSNMIDLSSGVDRSGASILTRDNQGVTLDMSSSDLDPGAVYTIWWVIFNKPGKCATTPCGEPDLGNPGALPSVLWATGFIADGTGTANVRTRLQRSNPPGEVLFGPGLANVDKAEVHIVLRSHGAPVLGSVDQQISTFDFGCGVCVDQQASIHMPGS